MNLGKESGIQVFMVPLSTEEMQYAAHEPHIRIEHDSGDSMLFDFTTQISARIGGRAIKDYHLIPWLPGYEKRLSRVRRKAARRIKSLYPGADADSSV